MDIRENREIFLKLNKVGSGLEMHAAIRNGALDTVLLRFDRHKGSSLPPEWDERQIPGGITGLETLRDFCEEMIREIKIRLAGDVIAIPHDEH